MMNFIRGVTVLICGIFLLSAFSDTAFSGKRFGKHFHTIKKRSPYITRSKSIIEVSEEYQKGLVIVSFRDRKLYFIDKPGKAISYPIAIPRDQDKWEGTLRVTQKKVNPSWTPTADMLKDNPKLPKFVPGGHPQNPMGSRALYLGDTLYRIHGTDAPSTIGRNVSRGCVRMLNRHVEELYTKVPTGSTVMVTWKGFDG